MEDKSSAQSIATDIFNMIQSAKESGLYLEGGFQNQPFKSPSIELNYLFFPKEILAKVPNMPDSVKKQLKKANVLATIDVNGKKAGIHLICAMNMPFGEVKSEEQVLAGINRQGLANYESQLKVVLKADLDAAMEPDDPKDTPAQ